MNEFSQRIMEEFFVRNTRAQKDAFCHALVERLRESGYEAKISVDPLLLKNRNVMVGDLERAQYVITAHYDTPKRMFLPANAILPQNMVLSLLYQCLWCLVPLAAGYLLTALIGLIAPLPSFWRMELPLIVFLVLMTVLFFGFANQHNMNDNTSGVLAVTETLLALPPEFRGRVAAVYFDNEEWGLLGSAAVSSKYSKILKNKPVINMDCVGVGDEICFLLCKQARYNEMLKCELLHSLSGVEGKTLRVVADRGWFYPSDQTNFRQGVGVASFRRHPRLGLYSNNIHNHRDTELDEMNVLAVRNTLLALIGGEDGGYEQ